MMDKIVAFFKPPDPKTLAKQWQSQIRKEQRQLDAQVRDIERELAKTRREIKACLKRKDQKSAKVLAMHTCKARKTIEALYETKANYDSISMRLGESVGRLTQVGSVGKSSEILKSMNAIANVGRASKDVVAMSKEMFKMGIIEDVLEDTLATSTHFSNTEEDEETDAEVDAILKEIAGEVRVTLPEPSVAEAKTSKATVEADATSSSFDAAAKENNAQPAKVLPEGGNDPGSIIDENTTRDMQSRLDALRE